MKANFSKKGKLDPNKGGGPGSAKGPSVNHQHRGGFKSQGQKNVPGGHASKKVTRPGSFGGGPVSIDD